LINNIIITGRNKATRRFCRRARRGPLAQSDADYQRWLGIERKSLSRLF